MRRLSLSSSLLLIVLLVLCATLAGFVSGRALAQSPKAAKAYLLVQADVTRPEQYQEYAKYSPAIVAKHGGRYLARAGRTLTLEGSPAKSRVVVVEFPSWDHARAFYDSPEYTAARKLRAGAGDAQFVVVEGVE